MSQLHPQRAVDLVVEELRHRILDGQYPVGTRLPAERTLSSELGINRLTLRAAISYLESEGLVRAQQGQGITVCNYHHTASLDLLQYLSMDERISEVISLRQLIIAEAVSHACSNATPTDINRLRSILDQQSRQIEEAQFLRGDDHFFNTLIESSQHFSLQLLYNSVRRVSHAHPEIGQHLLNNRPQALGSYRSLIKLIANRNPGLAKKTIMGHLSESEKLEVTQILTT